MERKTKNNEILIQYKNKTDKEYDNKTNINRDREYDNKYCKKQTKNENR